MRGFLFLCLQGENRKPSTQRAQRRKERTRRKPKICVRCFLLRQLRISNLLSFSFAIFLSSFATFASTLLGLALPTLRLCCWVWHLDQPHSTPPPHPPAR